MGITQIPFSVNDRPSQAAGTAIGQMVTPKESTVEDRVFGNLSLAKDVGQTLGSLNNAENEIRGAGEMLSGHIFHGASEICGGLENPGAVVVGLVRGIESPEAMESALGDMVKSLVKDQQTASAAMEDAATTVGIAPEVEIAARAASKAIP